MIIYLKHLFQIDGDDKIWLLAEHVSQIQSRP